MSDDYFDDLCAKGDNIVLDFLKEKDKIPSMDEKSFDDFLTNQIIYDQNGFNKIVTFVPCRDYKIKPSGPNENIIELSIYKQDSPVTEFGYEHGLTLIKIPIPPGVVKVFGKFMAEINRATYQVLVVPSQVGADVPSSAYVIEAWRESSLPRPQISIPESIRGREDMQVWIMFSQPNWNPKVSEVDISILAEIEESNFDHWVKSYTCN